MSKHFTFKLGCGQRLATNVSNSSRLVKVEAQSGSSPVVPLACSAESIILPSDQEQQKMDVDVEMKSVNTTPTKLQPLTLPSLATATAANAMQTDLASFDEISAASSRNKCQLTLRDPNSGIENMETSEQASPVITPQKEITQNTSFGVTQKSPKSAEERLEVMLSKMLNASWNENCTGSMICPQTASFLEKHPGHRYNFESLISNVLMECVLRLYNDEETIGDSGNLVDSNNDDDMKNETGANSGLDANHRKDSTPTYSTPKKIKSDDSEVQEILANAIDDQPSTSRGLQSGKH